jgi:hypothetical protein
MIGPFVSRGSGHRRAADENESSSSIEKSPDQVPLGESPWLTYDGRRRAWIAGLDTIAFLPRIVVGSDRHLR